MITSNIKSLNGQYIICKRVKKVPFYFRGDMYSQTSRTANSAFKFSNLEEATAKCAEINAKRKGGYKFRVEPATKHFVSNFSVGFNHWNDEVQVENRVMSIQRFQKVRNVNHDLNSKKEEILTSISRRIENVKISREKAEQEYKASLEQKCQQLERLSQLFAEVQKTDFNSTYVEPNLTATDKSVNVLFGVK